MLCDPPLSEEISQVAVLAFVPDGTSTFEFVHVKGVRLSAKLTVPVGDPSPAVPVTMAVNVSAVP